MSRSPRGERGLKSISQLNAFCCSCRSPRGERGLKFHTAWWYIALYPVALLAESVDWNIIIEYKLSALLTVALLAESVDWNANSTKTAKILLLSLSSRRAWIEIPIVIIFTSFYYVALLAESVDWNNAEMRTGGDEGIVALLAESVDWN